MVILTHTVCQISFVVIYFVQTYFFCENVNNFFKNLREIVKKKMLKCTAIF